MVQITAVQMVGGTYHEHINQLYWVALDGSDKGWATRQQMVDFLTNNPGEAMVRDNDGEVEVRVVNANPKYVRTYADGRWTDNLLHLPGGPYAS